MKACIAIAVMVVSLLAPIMALAADQADEWFGLPLVEIEEVVNAWLSRNGYAVYRVAASHQRLELAAEKPGSHLWLTLMPRSPLATRVMIGSGAGEDDRPARALRSHLVGYAGSADHASVHASVSPEAGVPDLVRRQTGAVVCISSNPGSEDIRLSGFVIDVAGWVVCTAHDLKLKQPVTLMLGGGREISGRVVRVDTPRDLALIQAQEPLPQSVSLRNGRYLLRNGDALFAVTCPRSGFEGVETGTVDGPPRRVDGWPLWQARLRVDPGSSGSPVFDQHGRLAAVVKGRYRGTDSIGFLIPFETLLHFLEKY